MINQDFRQFMLLSDAYSNVLELLEEVDDLDTKNQLHHVLIELNQILQRMNQVK